MFTVYYHLECGNCCPAKLTQTAHFAELKRSAQQELGSQELGSGPAL